MGLSRKETSDAVRTGIKRGLQQDELPHETDGWEKKQTPNVPPQPSRITRENCADPIRQELRMRGVPPKKTRRMLTSEIGSPGEDPGTIKNVVDYCFSIIDGEEA
jgi:hypothetical protein